MDVAVRGKNLPLTDAIKGYVDRKIVRLARYWPSITRAEVTCTTEPTRGVESRHHVEASITVGGMLFHAEEAAGDLYTAIDGVSEKLERQLRRKKGYLNRRQGATVRREQAKAGGAAVEDEETAGGEEV